MPGSPVNTRPPLVQPAGSSATGDGAVSSTGEPLPEGVPSAELAAPPLPEPTPAEVVPDEISGLPPAGSAMTSPGGCRGLFTAGQRFGEKIRGLSTQLSDRVYDFRDGLADFFRDPLYHGGLLILGGVNWLLQVRTVSGPQSSDEAPLVRTPSPPEIPSIPEPREIFESKRVQLDQATGRHLYHGENGEPMDVSHALRDPSELCALLATFTGTPPSELQRLQELIKHPPDFLPPGFSDGALRYRRGTFTVPAYHEVLQARAHANDHGMIRDQLSVMTSYDVSKGILCFEIRGLLPKGEVVYASYTRFGQSMRAWEPEYVENQMQGHDPAIFQNLSNPTSLQVCERPLARDSGTTETARGLSFQVAHLTLKSPTGYAEDLASMLFFLEYHKPQDELAALLAPVRIGHVSPPNGGIFLSDNTAISLEEGILQFDRVPPGVTREPLHLVETMEWLNDLCMQTREVTYLPVSDPRTGGTTLFIYIWDRSYHEWKVLGRTRFARLGTPLFFPERMNAARNLAGEEFGFGDALAGKIRNHQEYELASAATQSTLLHPRFRSLDTSDATQVDQLPRDSAGVGTVYTEEVMGFLARIMDDEEDFFWGVSGKSIFLDAAAERLSFAGFVCDAVGRRAIEEYMSGTVSETTLRILRDHFVFAESRPVPRGTMAAWAERFVDRQDERGEDILVTQSGRVLERSTADPSAFLVFFDMRPGRSPQAGGGPKGSESKTTTVVQKESDAGSFLW